MAILFKKYPNRRLYDTTLSRYVTLEELAETIRRGRDVLVEDASTNEDLTQQTLAQIILEGRGAARLLPVPLLVQLIRLGDEALAEFMGRYVAWALEVYTRVRQGVQALPWSPFGGGGLGLGLPASFAGLGGPWTSAPQGAPAPRPPAAPGQPAPPPPASPDDLAALRKELDALKRRVSRAPRKKKKA